MEHLWRWAGACSVGTSHIRTGRGCDNSAACIEYQHDNGSALLAVVSDGAGSAHSLHWALEPLYESSSVPLCHSCEVGGRSARLMMRSDANGLMPSATKYSIWQSAYQQCLETLLQR